MIKELKKGNQIFQNLEEKEVLEDGTVVWNIPIDLEEFKGMAIDTINWQIGAGVKRAAGNTNTNLSAANAKGIVLLAKVINAQNPDVGALTDLEKYSWKKMISLAEGGYGDSELLKSSLSKVAEYISAGTGKIERVVKSKTADEVIAILNEER